MPGTPPAARLLMAAGRAAFASAYARTYRRGPRGRMPLVESWLAVQVAARLSEGIEVEQPKLIGLLDRARRRATR